RSNRRRSIFVGGAPTRPDRRRNERPFWRTRRLPRGGRNCRPDRPALVAGHAPAAKCGILQRRIPVDDHFLLLPLTSKRIMSAVEEQLDLGSTDRRRRKV